MASVVFGLYPRLDDDEGYDDVDLAVLLVGAERGCDYFRPCRAVPLVVFGAFHHKLIRLRQVFYSPALLALDLTSAYLAFPSAPPGPFRVSLKYGHRYSPDLCDGVCIAASLHEYIRGVAERYGVEGSWSIFSRVRIPGRGAHLDERFAVYAVEGDFLQVESPEGVVPAFRFVLGTSGDRWVLLGKDGLYLARFEWAEGPGGRVGYAVVEGPYWGEVRAVEGPPFLGDVLPSTPTAETKCPRGALQVGDSEFCVRDDEVFHIATRWPLATFRGTPGQYAVRLAQLLHKKHKAKLATVNI